MDSSEASDFELRLRQREQALESVSSGVVITGTLESGCAIVYINKAFTRITGYEPSDVVGKSCRILQGGDTDQPALDDVRRALSDGTSCSALLRNYRKDDTPFLNQLTISPVVDERGNLSHWVGVIDDVSERRRKELLQRERDGLSRALKASEEVLGVVGHELRTPLAGIRLITELLLEKQIGDDEDKEFLRTIHDEVIAMSTFTADLLEAARETSGNARWSWSEFPLTPALGAALRAVPMLVTPAVEFRSSVEPADAFVRGDRLAIGRLVLNLVTNAIKHTSSGQIDVGAVVFSEGTGESEKRWLKIDVRDTGSGVNAEVVKRLGQAFALNAGVVSAGAQLADGTGLGLSVCKGIAAAHGGHLRITSTSQQGTTVEAWLRADLEKPANGVVLPPIAVDILK